MGFWGTARRGNEKRRAGRWATGDTTVGATGDGIFPGWWLVGLVGLVGLILAVATGLAGFHLTTWVLRLEDELGVGVETVAAAVVTFSLLSWVLEPVAGFLADRVVSIRWLVIPGLVIMAGAYFFLSQIQSAWMVFAVASVMAVGAAMCGWVLLMALLCRWFVRRRTLAVALASMAVPLGSLFLIPLIFYASDIGFVGWRNTAIVLGVFVLLIAAAALAWLRNRPEDRGLLPYGASATMQLPRFRALQALRTRGFWLIAVGDGLAAMGIEKTLGSEEGSGERAIALAVIGIVALPFMLVAGLLGDRVSKSSLLALFAALQVVGLVLFAFIDTPAAAYFCAAVLAAGEGGRAPLRVSIMADYFGADSLATILGLFGFFAGFTGFAGSLLVLPMYQVIADGMVPLVPAGLALVAAYCFLKARAPQLPAAEEAEEAEVSGYC